MKRSEKISMIWQEVRSEMIERGGSWVPSRLAMLNVPSIHPAEVFSSWFWRAAVKSGLTISGLKRIWDIRGPTYLHDIRLREFDYSTVISKVNAVTINDLNSMRWDNYSPVSIRQGLWLTLDLLAETPIYRYCPLCLANDTEPHFRKAWRLAFNYVCVEHGVMLRNKCSCCEKTINLSRLGEYAMTYAVRSFSLRICQECGADLSKQCVSRPSKFVTDRLWQFQLQMAMQLHAATADNRIKAPEGHLEDKISSQYWQLDLGDVLHSVYEPGAARNQNLGIDVGRVFQGHASTVKRAMKMCTSRYESTFLSKPNPDKSLGKRQMMKLSRFISSQMQRFSSEN